MDDFAISIKLKLLRLFRFRVPFIVPLYLSFDLQFFT